MDLLDVSKRGFEKLWVVDFFWLESTASVSEDEQDNFKTKTQKPKTNSFDKFYKPNHKPV